MTTSRNTVNQRLSRERRKTYLASLEERIQYFERQGVQVTKEVQIAAQKVVDENEQLRAENERLQRLPAGRSDLELRGRCPRCGRDDPAGEQSVKERVKEKQAHPRRKKRKLPPLDQSVPEPCKATSPGIPQHIAGAIKQKSTPDDRHDVPVAAPPLPSSTQESLPRSNEVTSPVHSSRPGQVKVSIEAAPACSPLSTSVSSQSPTSHPSCQASTSTCKSSSSNTMPCTQAALIIAGMRGDYQSQSDIYPDLGCSPDDLGCNVESLRVMEVMEQD